MAKKDELPAAELQAVMQKVINPQNEMDFEDGVEINGESGRKWYKYHVDGEIQLLPKPIEKMTDEDWLHTKITLDNVQTSKIPQELTVKFKDPQWAGRWFNKSSKQGVRVNQARYLGFIPAKKEDLDWVFDARNINDADGAVEQGDLVLFKIHKAKLAKMLQERFHEARLRGTTQSFLGNAEANVLVPDNHKKNFGFNIAEPALKEKQGLGPVVSM